MDSSQAADIDVFRDVVNISRRMDLRVWLDQGTLLGAIRDGTVLSWDHDLDLGVWYTEFLPVRKQFIRELRAKGYRINVTRYVLKVKLSHRDGYGKGVDLRMYHEREGRAWAELRAGHKKPRHGLERCLPVMRKKIKINTRRALRFKALVEQTVRVPPGTTPIDRSLVALAQLFYDIWFWLHEQVKDRTVFCMDADYYHKFDETSFLSTNVIVPANPEAYLLAKYGHDWRIPKKEWVYWRDDGALYAVLKPRLLAPFRRGV